MGANGVPQPQEHISHDTIQKWINEFTHGARISGSFSTHCFRRGGAQYRFMFAPVGQRWTLRTVRWWGGWAEGEHVSSFKICFFLPSSLKRLQRDTLIRYLLDELGSYEDDFSGSLCPVQSGAAITLLGEHSLVKSATTEEVHMMYGALSTEVRNIHGKLGSMESAISGLCSNMHALTSVVLGATTNIQGEPIHFFFGQNMRRDPDVALRGTGTVAPQAPTHPTLAHLSDGVTTRALLPISLNYVQVQQQPTCRPQLTPTVTESYRPVTPEPPSKRVPTAGLFIPDLPLQNANGTRTPRNESWKHIVTHWQHGDASRGLHTPLKDWPPKWLRGANRLFAMKHHQRGVIATEFLAQ
jgi:hypothetical protein